MDYTKVPVLGFILEWMDDNDMDPGPFITTMATSLLVLGLFVLGISAGQIFSVVIALTPIWLPLMLFFIFFWKWMDTVGVQYYLNQGRSTLRIKLPQEIMKSPEAMEFVLAQIHNTAAPDNLMQTYLQGKRPLPFSFEIASIGGDVRFYVNVPRKKTRDAFEANMYAQYPGIEIVEEPVDYAAEIPLGSTEFDTFTAHMGKKKEQEFPLKTYIDYGLDKMPKEEEKVDPITPTLEVLASIKPHERLYVQMICVTHREQSFKHGQLVSAPKWTEGVKKKIDELMMRDPKTKGPVNEGTESDFEGMPRITPGERSVVEMMERHMGKYAYETAIRFVYVYKNGQFNGDLVNPVIRMFSQYDGANGVGVRWRTDFDYMSISDPSGKRLKALKQQEFKEFKLRKYFPKASGDGYKIFTVEELATMFHLPGRVAMTPGLSRIPSTRSEAPPNLPTGNLPE